MEEFCCFIQSGIAFGLEGCSVGWSRVVLTSITYCGLIYGYEELPGEVWARLGFCMLVLSSMDYYRVRLVGMM